MPYADPKTAKQYNTNYQRMRRAGATGNKVVDLPPSFRIKTAQDVLGLLESIINEVRDAEVDVLSKARCIGYLAGITLKSIETANLEARLIDVEETLKRESEL